MACGPDKLTWHDNKRQWNMLSFLPPQLPAVYNSFDASLALRPCHANVSFVPD